MAMATAMATATATAMATTMTMRTMTVTAMATTTTTTTVIAVLVTAVTTMTMITTTTTTMTLMALTTTTITRMTTMNNNGNCGGSGSVVITRYQWLPLSPRESPPRMCHPVVLAPRTPWGAFRRGFRRVPRSLDFGTHRDITTWAMSHQVFIAGTACISSKGPCIPLPLTHMGQSARTIRVEF
jgi:hypothetical protein